MQGPQAAANSAKKKKIPSLPSNNFAQKLAMPMVSQASSVKVVVRKSGKWSESQNQCCTMQWAKRVDIITQENKNIKKM